MIKRIFDFTIAIILGILLLPLIICIALIIRCTLGAPILFRQIRPGKNETPFILIKFRTMLVSHNESQDDQQRLTKIGRIIRATSLDELPELWNIIKGDMSFVGPRPLLMEYLPLYNEKQKGRHQVRPGLTGWAQINGRNNLSWEARFEHDLWYIENQSFWLDLKILICTGLKVLRREGITSNNHVTMSKFTGSST